MSTTDAAPDAPRPRDDDPAHATHAVICVLRLEAELAALRETAAALVEELERTRAGRRTAVGVITTVMRAVERRSLHFRPLEIWTNSDLFALMRSAVGPHAACSSDGGAGES